jgi:hypothetical protein
MAARAQLYVEKRLRQARKLYGSAVPARGTPAETYLRRGRGIDCQIPGHLRYLPARRPYSAAMIAPFGMADELEPGVLTFDMRNVKGVHITKIAPDGLRKAGTTADKIMIGPSKGWPIMLMPATDNHALDITEGIEDALSMHVATGRGAWAAGSAGHMPALADRVPSYIESVTIAVDQDDAGQKNANKLGEALRARGIEVHLLKSFDGRAA